MSEADVLEEYLRHEMESAGWRNYPKGDPRIIAGWVIAAGWTKQEPREADAAEKKRRIYYQDIVYTICNYVDRAWNLGCFGPFSPTSAGTFTSPCNQTQARVLQLVERFMQFYRECPEPREERTVEKSASDIGEWEPLRIEKSLYGTAMMGRVIGEMKPVSESLTERDALNAIVRAEVERARFDLNETTVALSGELLEARKRLKPLGITAESCAPPKTWEERTRELLEDIRTTRLAHFQLDEVKAKCFALLAEKPTP